MKEILISTESGSDVPKEVEEKYHIHIVPMHVIIDNVSYDDNLDHVDRVFDYFERTGRVPSTSCVNSHEYTEFFHKLQNEHPGCEIYHFSYSSNASGTWQAARIAIEQNELSGVHLIDTRTCTGGCTAMIVEAYNLLHQKAGTTEDPVYLPDDYDFNALADEMQAIAPHIECEFIPNTLEYLRAGGRVSNAKFLVANVLHLKPLIEINHDGYLLATKKYRGDMSKIVDRFFADFNTRFNLKKDVIYLMYGKGLPQNVLDRMKELAGQYGFRSSVYIMTGCVISSHGGKGAIGLAGVTV